MSKSVTGWIIAVMAVLALFGAPRPVLAQSILKLGYGTCIVRPGQDAMANGAVLRSAVQDGECDLLVRMLPGDYKVDSPLYVYARNLEGSGEQSTFISGPMGSCVGLLRTGGVEEMRDFTVHNLVSVGACSIAIQIESRTRLARITARGLGGTNRSIGVGITDAGNPGSMRDVTATASGSGVNSGIYLFTPIVLKMIGVTAAASGGTSNYGVHLDLSHHLDVHDSWFSGSTASIFGAATAIRLSDTQVEGPLVGVPGPGIFRCVDVYDANLDPVTCP